MACDSYYLSHPCRTHSEELRQELGWMTLERRREVSRMKLMHRSVNRPVPSSIHDRIQPVKRKTRGECKLFLPRANTDIYKKSFTFRGIQVWNSLPSDLRILTSTSTFIKHLRTVM